MKKKIIKSKDEVLRYIESEPILVLKGKFKLKTDFRPEKKKKK